MARHESREVRRAQVLAAATRCIGEKGYERTTMDDIVRASGLSKGSLYWHFDNKEAILLALFDQYAEEMEARWPAAPQNPTLTSRQQRLHQILEGSLNDLLAARWLVESWMEFLHHPVARSRMSALYARYRQILQLELNELVDHPQETAMIVVATLEGLVLQVLVDKEVDPLPAWRTLRTRILGF